MAIRQITVITCDRCGKDEETTQTVQDSRAPTLEVHSADHDDIEYADLCKRCRARVDKLVTALGPQSKKGDPEAE